MFASWHKYYVRDIFSRYWLVFCKIEYEVCRNYDPCKSKNTKQRLLLTSQLRAQSGPKCNSVYEAW